MTQVPTLKSTKYSLMNITIKMKYMIEKWLNLFEERGERKVFLTASVKIKV